VSTAQRGPQPGRAQFMRAVRRYLINGLLIWVPVLVTVLVVRFILQLMDQTLLVLPHAIRPETLLGLHIPGFGAVLGLLIVLITGLLVTNFIGQALVGIGEDLLERIPFVRALYSGVKSFSETVLSNSGNSFKKVLLIEYPRAWGSRMCACSSRRRLIRPPASSSSCRVPVASSSTCTWMRP